jgi:hypothetical protein
VAKQAGFPNVIDKRTFEQGFKEGYYSILPGAPIAYPPHVVPAGKTPYQWGFEQGVTVAGGTKINR